MTTSSVSEVASTDVTTSIAAWSEIVHFFWTCSIENFASSAVKGSPLENVAPSSSWKV